MADVPADQRLAFLEQAFDYRGDVTLGLTDGRTIEGYLFDRRKDGADSSIRIWLKDSDDKATVRYDEIARLSFTGRDTAEGRSWETWVRKFAEKKANGEEASIFGEHDNAE